MSAMVERVARAMAPGAWGDLHDALYAHERREDSLINARLAIAALREPTEAMVEIYMDQCSMGGDLVPRDGENVTDAIGRVFGEMIDEALK